MLTRFALLFALAAPASPAAPSFVRDIAPILVRQCVECHRPEKARGGYRLDTWDALQIPGDSASPALTPGRPEQSELFRLLVVHDEDDRMPKKSDPLPQKQINLIHDWIKAGAPFDGTPKNAAAPLASLIPETAAPPAPDRYPAPLPVTALALSPDCQTLAVNGYREVTLWDAATGRLKTRLPCPAERTLSLAWIPSLREPSRLVAAGGTPGRSGSLFLLDPSGKSPPLRLLQTRDTLHRVVITPDGQHALTAGASNTLHSISLSDQSILWSSEAHADWVIDLALSPDGTRLATASRDRTARLIHVKTGEIEATFTAHTAAVTSVLFSADGKSVFSAAADGEIRNWNFEGEAIKDTTLKPGCSEITSLTLADSLLVAAMADGRLIPLDLVKRSSLPPLLTRKDRLEIARARRQNNSSPWMLLVGGQDGRLHRLFLPPPAPAKTAATHSPAPPPETPPLPAPLQFIASPGW